MVRWIQAVGASIALLTIHVGVSAQTSAYPVLFLADSCSDSSVWNEMLRHLPRHRFGDELIRLHQGADGGVHARDERQPAGAPSFALDFYDPSERSFNPRVIADIRIDRKVEQVRAAIDYIVGATGQSHLVVVAHGMGGLVARAYVQGRGVTAKATAILYRSDIAALVAIDTPHAGVEVGGPAPHEWDRECAAADTVNRREMLPGRNAFLEALNRHPWPSGTRLDAIASYSARPDRDTDGLVLRASQDIASLSEYWERHPDVHVWPQRFLDAARVGPGGAMLHTAVVGSPVTAALVHSLIEEVDRAQEAGIARPLDHLDPHIESPHPYPNNYDNEWTWTAPGNPSALDVTFDARTSVEENYDFIFVMDGDGNNVSGSPFTGTSLAGRTVRVPGSTIRLRLTTDSSVTEYGLRVTGLAAVAASALPESSHPYSNNTDTTWSYTLPGNPAAIDVTFDPQTSVESDYDFIYVMDSASGNISGSPFTGTSLAGRTVRVSGSTVRVRLTSDSSLTDYGFRIASVTAAPDAPATPTWTLSGTVRDAQSNAALSGVTALVTSGANANRTTTTDASGSYTLANLQQGTFAMRFSLSGYDTLEGSVTLTQNSSLAVTLTRTAPPPPRVTVIAPEESGTSVCRQSVGTEPTAFGIPIVTLDRDTANVGVGGSAELTARPVGARAEDVTLRWWLGRYGTLLVVGCEATYVAPDSIGSAFQVSSDIWVAKDGNRRSPNSFTGQGFVRINIYDNSNLPAPCNSASVTVTLGPRFGGIVSVSLQGVGTWFPVGTPSTFTLPVGVRRGLYTLTLVSTGQPTYSRNITVGCPRTTVYLN